VRFRRYLRNRRPRPGRVTEAILGLAFIVAGAIIAGRWRPRFLRRLKGSAFDPVIRTVVILWGIGVGAVVYGLIHR
jgi:hypothetical protein